MALVKNSPNSSKRVNFHFLGRFKEMATSGLRVLKSNFRSERGSIVVVVIGLFVVSVACLMVMTDIGALIVAKRSLVQATEAAAQRGVQTLDKSAYYQGKANMFTVPLAIATGREHPVIPIDCERGGYEVLLELNSWSQTDMKWQQLKKIELTNFICDGKFLKLALNLSSACRSKCLFLRLQLFF